MNAVFDHPFDALARRAAEAPDEDGLVFPHQQARLSAGDWYDRALRVAGGLKGLGIGPGDHVALIAENRWEWPVVQLGVAAAGAVFVPLNTHYRRDDLIHALKLSGAKAIFLSRAFRSNAYLEMVEAVRGDCEGLRHVICFDDADNAMPFETLMASEPYASPGAASGPGAILFTSGTTGEPKGAVLSHRAMMMNARGVAERLDIRRGDRVTSIIPLFHCAGCVMGIQGVLQRGAAYVGVPAFDPVTMFEVIQNEACTFCSGVPTSWLAMLRHPGRADYDLSSLRGGTCGGADANPALLAECAEAFPIPGLAQVYGQTEGATLLTSPFFDDPERFVTCGPPLPGFEVRIADAASGEALPAGATGEVQGRGPMVMLGYHNRPEATAETITADGWLRTGDLGYLTAEGKLVIAGGRLRDMIIRGGENVYPAEIENLMQTHAAIEAVAVFAMPDDYYGEAVAAAVRLGGPATAGELQGFIGERIARFKVPSVIYLTDRFPLTSSGKVRKVELREWAMAGRMEVLP